MAKKVDGFLFHVGQHVGVGVEGDLNTAAAQDSYQRQECRVVSCESSPKARFSLGGRCSATYDEIVYCLFGFRGFSPIEENLLRKDDER
ncbi:MAG: hypothetical protein DRJ65_11550 [Acidobacteria bacterium]|nr:MAG: hypothetical protein DRJ65_11550 [Acidobacteriota bacterium]